MIDRRGILLALAAAWTGVAAAAPRIPRARDLEGTWTTATYTELERPDGLTSLILTPAEADAYEAPRRTLNGMLPAKAGEVGQAEAEWNERGDGLARVRGEIRSSWIVDPSDGRIPFTPAAVIRLGLTDPAKTWTSDNPERRSGPERCLANVIAGAPMAGSPDTNLFQIVQTRDSVAIHSEKYHDVRIVRMEEAKRPDHLPPSWLGDSAGRWQGETLVVETLAFRPGVTHRGQRLYFSETTRVVERFRRQGPRELFYEFTVEDPHLFTQPWRGEMVFHAAVGQIYEYACHEGNYGMRNILGGARAEEAVAASTP